MCRAKAEALLEEKSRELFLSYESLQQSNEELASALNEIKEKQHQLVHSEKMASLGVMSAGIAHEINNPLAFVMSNINSLSESCDSIRQFYEHVNTVLSAETEQERESRTKELELFAEEEDLKFLINDSVDLVAETAEGLVRMKDILADLQSFARPDSGMIEAVDVNECINTTLKIARAQFSHDTEVKLDFGELPEIRAYSSKLGQVILNLLVNASHAMSKQPSDKPKVISINTYHKDGTVTIAVTDSGCGMNQATVDSIFTPFFTTKKVGKGTGLGLSISHGIIEDHQGTLTVESTPDVGTTFTITLPVSHMVSKAA